MVVNFCSWACVTSALPSALPTRPTWLRQTRTWACLAPSLATRLCYAGKDRGATIATPRREEPGKRHAGRGRECRRGGVRVAPAARDRGGCHRPCWPCGTMTRRPPTLAASRQPDKHALLRPLRPQRNLTEEAVARSPRRSATPTEQELMKAMGVSRTVVREAWRRCGQRAGDEAPGLGRLRRLPTPAACPSASIRTV